VLAVLAVSAVPAGVVLAWRAERVTLVESTYGSIPLGLVLGVIAFGLGRRARQQLVWTLGRSGGGTAARAGRILGVLGICMALTAALAIGFYGLLTLFAD
jgi:hypothetical protein